MSTVAAGDPIYASGINQFITRKATSKLTSDSTTWSSTELEATTVTATLVSGERYAITFRGRLSSDVGGDSANIRIREDNLTGTQLSLFQAYIGSNSGNGYAHFVYAEYTAASSGSKTFSLTAQRSIGTGTAHRIRASATAPAWMIVELIKE